MDTGQHRGFEVSVEEPGIAIIRFNTPERLNGMTQGTKRDLVELVLQAQMDDTIRVLLLTGEGRAFCAGDDITGGYRADLPGTPLAGPIPEGHGDAIGTYNGLRVLSQSVNTAIRNCEKITIAALNGFAIQTGLSMALSCDFRIAAESARLGSATLRFGMMPDEGGHYLLVQHLGLAGALDFMLRKRIVDASEALALGLVHEVVPNEQLPARALELARELANGPQVAMRFLKRSIYLAAESTWEQALDDIATKTAITDHLPDTKEGGASFREKRQATFNQDLPVRGS